MILKRYKLQKAAATAAAFLFLVIKQEAPKMPFLGPLKNES
jgi:hypothetical protein